MFTNLLRLCVAASLMFAASPSFAGKKGGVTMPDSINVGDKTLKLNGMGIREATVFKVDVYVAGLYVETPSKDASKLINTDEAKRIVMHFVRDVEVEKITEAFVESFDKLKASGANKKKLAKINGWMTNMEEGGKIVLTYVPGEGTSVSVNGKKKGTVDGADFAKAMWSVWLGPKPPNKGLKKGMLGNS